MIPCEGVQKKLYVIVTGGLLFFSYLKNYLFIYVFVCLCECMPCVCRCPWRPEEGVGSFGTGISGDCELPDVGAFSSVLEEQPMFLTAEPILQPFLSLLVVRRPILGRKIFSIWDPGVI